MTMTDPIADLLTRIRNASKRGKKTVDIPSSGLKKEIVRILREEKFIDNFTLLEDDRQGVLRVFLRYGPDKQPVISGLKRISRPGRRIYKGKSELPRVSGGIGIAVISTSRGVMTDSQSREAGEGGEILCYVW